MASIGSSLDCVKIVKKGDVITVSETFAIQNFTGQGYSNQMPSLETTTNTVVHRKENLQISIQNKKIIIRSLIGASHTFYFAILDAEGVKSASALDFAQDLIK